MARILIIEDDLVVRTLMEQTLTAAGHAVVLAENGRQGLEIHRAEQADLIITDIYMPEMEGLEFIRALGKANSKVPIIAVSGNFELHNALEIAKRLGAVKSLAKPFRAEELRTAVAVVLRGRAPD